MEEIVEFDNFGLINTKTYESKLSHLHALSKRFLVNKFPDKILNVGDDGKSIATYRNVDASKVSFTSPNEKYMGYFSNEKDTIQFLSGDSIKINNISNALPLIYCTNDKELIYFMNNAFYVFSVPLNKVIKEIALVNTPEYFHVYGNYILTFRGSNFMILEWITGTIKIKEINFIEQILDFDLLEEKQLFALYTKKGISIYRLTKQYTKIQKISKYRFNSNKKVNPNQISIHPSGNYVAYSSTSGIRIRDIEMMEDDDALVFSMDGMYTELAFSLDGSQLYAIGKSEEGYKFLILGDKENVESEEDRKSVV